MLKARSQDVIICSVFSHYPSLPIAVVHVYTVPIINVACEVRIYLVIENVSNNFAVSCTSLLHTKRRQKSADIVTNGILPLIGSSRNN